jgi:hypothetical protein
VTLATTLDRIAQLQALADPQAAARAAEAQRAAAAQRSAATQTFQTGSPSASTTPTGFAGALRTASSSGPTTPMIEAARSQQGVTEQPPGSNDAPQIAAYRQATEGAPGPGPWCAYFVSWAARQAGTPLGDRGQGFGSVDAMWSWAQGAGRGVPNGPGVTPQVGDVIILNQHTGIVTGVRQDGTVETIEGNTSDRVDVRTHPAGEAIGYVRMS